MNLSPFERLISEGVALHKNRRYAEAEALYRQAVALAPNDPEALSLLGLVLTRDGRLGEAIPMLERAVELDPRRPTLRLNLAEGLGAKGDFARAMGVLHPVLQSDPSNFRAWILAGDVAERQGDTPGAIEAWNRAHEAQPDAPGPVVRLARTELDRGKTAEALMILDAHLQRASGDEEILNLWCRGIIALRQWSALEENARRWSDVATSNPVPLRYLAVAQMELGRPLDAAANWERAMALVPPNAEDLSALGGCYLHAMDYSRAEDLLKRAELLQPSRPDLLSKLALVHMYYGRFAEAEDCARRCLEQTPMDATALKVLVRVRRGDVGDEELARLGQLAHDIRAAFDDRVASALAAAQVLDARDETDEAFKACEFAQAIARERDRMENRGYDREREEHRLTLLMSSWNAGPPASGERPDGPRPIFIVGMPRSGTTLIEAVLGAHPKVLALGERPAMRQVLHEHLSLAAQGGTPDEAALAKWRQIVLGGVGQDSAIAAFTDKHPRNLEAAGLITRLFPDARIVMLRRNPVETGLSIFRQEFSKYWDFAHDLADIGHFQGGYARLMAHWTSVLPASSVTTIQYEQFVGDFEAQARALVDFCGLEWDPACLDYANSPRAIATFSSVEVRDAVSLREHAPRYAAHLGPLVSALQDAGVDLATGALRAH